MSSLSVLELVTHYLYHSFWCHPDSISPLWEVFSSIYSFLFSLFLVIYVILIIHFILYILIDHYYVHIIIFNMISSLMFHTLILPFYNYSFYIPSNQSIPQVSHFLSFNTAIHRLIYARTFPSLPIYPHLFTRITFFFYNGYHSHLEF